MVALYAVNYIIVRHNLKSHIVVNVKAEAKGLGIGLGSLSRYFPNLNPIEYTQKSKRNVMSISSEGNLNAIRKRYEQDLL